MLVEKKLSNLCKVLGYLEDREGRITTFTPSNPPCGIRDSKGYRPPYLTVVYNGYEGELTAEEVARVRDFVFGHMLKALPVGPAKYNILIKPLWFQKLLLNKGK